ncbi:hypothetical protein FJ651_14070 [Paucihalobacter ruber]|uniref:Uncharacterized protein n=1 Tax=Paucihalobacter ruber TaxID=2567861 RepID=A0A506PDM3_9FLAO|nr:hypothetical protein [Paucihalobacter ruber]TPV31936.1 hypothetical protein FJ651_14070 [Paucihalobacter ruber]
MYKINLTSAFLIILFIFQSCSNDDSSSDDSYFLRVRVQNNNLSENNNVGIASSPVEECSSNDETLAFANIAFIETSTYGISAFLAHYEFSSEFDENAILSSRVIDSDLFYDFDSCFDVFDFYLDFSYNENFLEVDNSSSNVNNITNIEFIAENSQEAIYAISGNFSVTFRDIDNSPIVLTGEYRFPVYVLN